MSIVFPFPAIVGQDDMKLALLIAAVDANIGGVLVYGDRGTGKSTAVRALANLLPAQGVVDGCAYRCAPSAPAGLCERCAPKTGKAKLAAKRSPAPVVDLPLGATEDRIAGALDIERALSSGEKVFQPGLLARANGGFLYIDEVNLLEDHLVDLLLDVTTSGENLVEREGLSVRHPAKFVLIGSGNPEEGELRPQLLDRFGLCVDVKTPADLAARIEVVRRRDAFERDRAAFAAAWQKDEKKIAKKIAQARDKIAALETPGDILEAATKLCMALGTDGLRGELTLIRAARAVAALEGAKAIEIAHVLRIAPMALRHRLRRNPLDDVGSDARIARVIADVFGKSA